MDGSSTTHSNNSVTPAVDRSSLVSPPPAPSSYQPLVVQRHLPQDHLNQAGGDIAHQVLSSLSPDNQTPANHSDSNSVASLSQPLIRRLSLFSAVHDAHHRRELTALDINVAGGFRRDFLVQQSKKFHRPAPQFVADNFLEFLLLYGHFAGEEFNDDDDDDDEEAVDDDDERLLLLPPPLPRLVPNFSVGRDRILSYSGTRDDGPRRGHGATVAKTYFLVFKLLVGLGVLFLPRAFYNGGLSFSIATLTFFGGLTFFCYMVLIAAKRESGIGLFGELAHRYYGNTLKWCVTVLICISQVGFVGTYLLFTMENMGQFLSEHLGDKAPGPVMIFVFQFVVLVPLVLVRNIAKLSMVLMISLVCIVIGLVIITYFCFDQLIEHGLGPNITQFNPNSWTMLIGVAVTAFEGIGLILPIELAMERPEKFTEVLVVLMALITALFVGVGTIGYTAFGDQVKLIIILNLPGSNFFVQLIMVLYSVAVVLTAPLQLFPAIKIGELILFHRRRNRTGKLYTPLGKTSSSIKWWKNVYRVAVLLVVCGVAYSAADNIDKFVSINGCFACIPLVYIYPPLIHIRTVNQRGFSLRKEMWVYFGDYLVVTLGVVVMVYLAYQIFYLN